MTLFPDPAPVLTDYDVILVNTSAGKDSQAMLDLVCRLAAEAGILGRVVAVHADLGRVEWPGTPELAEAHAAHYGVRFIKVARPQGDLLDHIEQRGMFPSSTTRYCTSDHKRGQIRKVMTLLADEHRAIRGPPAAWYTNVEKVGVPNEDGDPYQCLTMLLGDVYDARQH